MLLTLQSWILSEIYCSSDRAIATFRTGNPIEAVDPGAKPIAEVCDREVRRTSRQIFARDPRASLGRSAWRIGQPSPSVERSLAVTEQNVNGVC